MSIRDRSALDDCHIGAEAKGEADSMHPGANLDREHDIVALANRLKRCGCAQYAVNWRRWGRRTR